MPGQPQLFPEPDSVRERQTPEVNAGSLRGGSPRLAESRAAERVQRSEPRTAPVWLQRVSLIVLVLFCVYLGVLVTLLPWWTRVWDHNMYILARPGLAAFLHNGAVRGVISGLGVLDIWIGISEAVHYRDYRG